MALRVLVAEDDDALREVLVETLEVEGFEAVPAQDGHELLDVFHTRGPFDVLLLDEHMPGLKGRECLARLVSEGHQIRAVLMSGSVQFDESEASPLGIRVWLRKPVPFEDITRAIHRAAAS